MKLPKTVNICGKTYTVTKDKKLFGGSATTGPQEIIVGTKHGKRERIFENIVHEVMESVACERDFRFSRGDSEGSVFVMTHKEFDCFVADVSTALRPMVKE